METKRLAPDRPRLRFPQPVEGLQTSEKTRVGVDLPGQLPKIEA